MTTAQNVVKRYLTAREFSNKKDLQDYLRQHPDADKSKHSVGKDPDKKGLKGIGTKVKKFLNPDHKTDKEKQMWSDNLDSDRQEIDRKIDERTKEQLKKPKGK
jgi:hypothetical protein